MTTEENRQVIDNEVFSLRDGESIAAYDQEPQTEETWLAIMLRGVEMPPGPRAATRGSDGAPVE